MSSSLILDSGHMTADTTNLVHLSNTQPFSSVRFADGSLLPVTQFGHLQSPSFTIPIVHHDFALASKLISISLLTNHGLTINFSSLDCSVQDHLICLRIGTGHRVGGLYHLEYLHIPVSPSFSRCTPTIVASICFLDHWHSCLGHVSTKRLKLLTSLGCLGFVSLGSLSSCMGCKLAKHSAFPFPSSDSSSVCAFDLFILMSGARFFPSLLVGSLIT